MDIEEYKRFLIEEIKQKMELLNNSDIEYIEGLLDGLSLAISTITRN